MRMNSLLVLAIRSILALMLAIVFSSVMATPIMAAAKTASVSGNWSSTATWGGSVPPTSIDSVTVNSGITVTINVSQAQCASITFNNPAAAGGITISGTNVLAVSGAIIMNAAIAKSTTTLAVGTGTLNAGSITISSANTNNWLNQVTVSTGTINCTGNFTFNSGTNPASAVLGATNSAAVITIGGDLTGGTGNGTLTLANPTNISLGGNYTFAGTLSANVRLNLTLNGTGTQTVNGTNKFKSLIVNKSIGTATAGANVIPNTGNLTVTAGTLDLLTFTANQAGGGGALTVSNGATLKIGGTNSMPTGYATYSFGAASTVEYNGTAQIVGARTYGNLTLSGSGAKTTTGATVNGVLSMEGTATTTGTVATYGVAATLQYKGSAAQTTGIEFPTTFAGSGGVIINNASGVALGSSKAITNGLTLTSGAFGVGTNTLTLNGIVSATSGSLTSSATGTVIYGSALAQTILAANYGNLTSSGAGARTLAPSGTVSVAGTFTPGGGAYTVTGSTVNYNASGVQTIAGFTYNSLSTSGSGIKTLGGATTANGNLDIGTGTTLDVSANNYTMIVKGNWSNSGTFTARSGTVTLAGLTTQTIGGSATTSFFNLAVNNVNGVTLNSNPTITGTLTLTSGIIATGTNTLIVSTGGLISGGSNSSYVNGNLQKAFNTGAGQSFTFHIGNASSYAPVSLASTNVSTAGSLTVKTTNGDHPNIVTSDLDASRSINRYWTLTAGGGLVATYNSTFNYLNSDLDITAVAAGFAVRRYNSGTWSASTVSGTPTSTSTIISGESGFGDFAIGNTTSIPNINAITLYQTDHTTAVTVMSPQTEYAVKVTVSNTSTLATLSTVKVTIFYDATGVYAPGNVPLSGNTQTAAILTFNVGGTPSWSIDAGAGSTWSIVAANCVQPALSAPTGDFWFHFKPGKVATATTGSAKWHIYAKATTGGGAGDSYQSNRTMNWYGEITVNTARSLSE